MPATLPALLPWIAPFAAGYAAVVAVLALAQRRVLYRPARWIADPRECGADFLEAVRQQGQLLGWHAPPPAEAPVIVVFHGNCGTLARIAAKIAPWQRFGMGLFAATYRGYEGNGGRPDEAGLYADARAVLDWLAARGVAPERIILYGESLGSGIAAQMAVERPVRGLILEAPYVSMADVAQWHYPWTPARWLVRDRFDTLAKIGKVACPLLILHGERDRTIPVGHSRRLAGAAAAEATLAVFPEAGHTDLYDWGATRVLEDFLERLLIGKANGMVASRQKLADNARRLSH
jgi:uncharacterized protein